MFMYFPSTAWFISVGIILSWNCISLNILCRQKYIFERSAWLKFPCYDIFFFYLLCFLLTHLLRNSVRINYPLRNSSVENFCIVSILLVVFYIIFFALVNSVVLGYFKILLGSTVNYIYKSIVSFEVPNDKTMCLIFSI